MHTRNTIPKMKINTIGSYTASTTDPDHKKFDGWDFDCTGLEGAVAIYWDQHGVLIAGYTPEELATIYNKHHNIQNLEFPSKPKRQLVDILAMDSDINETKKVMFEDLEYDITWGGNRIHTVNVHNFITPCVTIGMEDDTEELQAMFDASMESHTHPIITEVTEELRDFNEKMNAAFDRHEWLAAEGAFDSDHTGGCRRLRQSHLNATYSDYYDECMGNLQWDIS